MTFDIRRTPSKMGALTEAARQHPEAVRTEHSLLSMAVIGDAAESFIQCRDYTGIGPHSPFARLHELDGRIAVLDLTENDSMSFYHHVEQLVGASHRWTIDFTVQYTDAADHTEPRNFGFYARRRDDGVVTAVDPMGELLWKKGLYQGDRPRQGAGLRTIRAKDLFTETKQVLLNGNALGLLYEQHDNPQFK